MYRRHFSWNSYMIFIEYFLDLKWSEPLHLFKTNPMRNNMIKLQHNHYYCNLGMPSLSARPFLCPLFFRQRHHTLRFPELQLGAHSLAYWRLKCCESTLTQRKTHPPGNLIFCHFSLRTKKFDLWPNSAQINSPFKFWIASIVWQKGI